MRRQRNLLGPQGMGGMVSLWGQSSLIRSIQYGTTNTTAVSTTATITAVDTTNAYLFFLGCASNQAAVGGHWAGACVLTNSTTVTTSWDTATGDTRSLTFCVVEFQPGVVKSRQAFVVTCVSASSATATITAVDTTKAQILFDGMTTYDGSQQQYGRVTLTNATTVTLNRVSTDGYTTRIYGYVIEYF
jgi:3-mercaptopyruvate sulfurtransferase SseA